MAAAKKGSVLTKFFGAPDGAEPDGDEPAAGDGDGDAGLDQACDEMLAAIKSGDRAGFCEALKAAIDMHKSAPEPEPDGDEG